MRGSVLISFLGISMAMTGLVAGCGDDDEPAAPAASGAKSKEGESCAATSDCDRNLRCVGFVCVEGEGSGGRGGSGAGGDASGGTGGKGGTGTGGSGGTGTGGGTGGGTVTPPRLGGLGESCSSSADCEEDLGCFNGRCLDAPTGEGGGPNIPGPQLGGIGETCVLSSDCDEGLACLPQGGTGFVGVCTPVETGVAPTGKTCDAECLEAADCCELPVELHAVLLVSSCAELTEVIANSGVTCADPGAFADECFAQDVYCDCADAETQWACTNGSCLYRPNCSADGLATDGCPTFSRSGRQLISTCDTAGTGRCVPAAMTGLCANDLACEGAYVTDDNTDTCDPGECVCFNQSACLRACDEDLDCPFGKICSTTENVCIPDDTCDSDVTCQRINGDYRWACDLDTGTCTMPCSVDSDCNAIISNSFANVCDAGTCKPIGCTSDLECVNALDTMNPNPRRMFCTTPVAGAGADSGSSAITD